MNEGDIKTRFWGPEILSAAKVFGKDISAPAPKDGKPAVNSIFEPIIYHLYLKDLTTSPVKRATES